MVKCLVEDPGGIIGPGNMIGTSVTRAFGKKVSMTRGLPVIIGVGKNINHKCISPNRDTGLYSDIERGVPVATIPTVAVKLNTQA